MLSETMKYGTIKKRQPSAILLQCTTRRELGLTGTYLVVAPHWEHLVKTIHGEDFGGISPPISIYRVYQDKHLKPLFECLQSGFGPTSWWSQSFF